MEQAINNRVTLEDAAQIIAATGDRVTTIITSEPGTGKSSLRYRVAELAGIPKERIVYLDAPLLDFPDFYMPDVQNNKTFKAYSDDWLLDSTEPVLYMVDEIGKMQGVAKPMITRFLLERTVSSKPIPEGSIIFATSNLVTDGVGDMFPAHLNNRVSTMEIIKPDADSVVEFGTKYGMNGTLVYFVRENPEVCESYLDLDEEARKTNKYIFNPQTNTRQFVSNRSLWMASHTLDRMEQGKLSREQAMRHIVGAIGAPATAELWATVALADSLPTRQSIYTEPDKARVPDNMSAQLLLATRLASGMGEDNADATTTYMKRLEAEIQAVAGRLIFKAKPTLAMRTPAMREWVVQFTSDFVN